jgi:DNA-binding NtrC family response regulator
MSDSERQPRVLIIDDDQGILEAFTVLLEEAFRVYTAASGQEGLAVFQHEDIDVVLLDIRLPDIDGIEVLRQLKAIDSDPTVLMLTALNDARLAVEALREGATDYLIKPVNNDDLLARLRYSTAQRRRQQEMLAAPTTVPPSHAPKTYIGRSPAIRQLLATVRRVAATDATVLISGETGVGKDLIARIVHHHSHRCTKPFVAVNCAAIAESLAESEFLGHERGAFTGAEQRRMGKFEQAHTGTLYLDEVSSLRPQTQAMLLRVLQGHEFHRVGGQHFVRVDVRVVASTNQALQKLVTAGSFRGDLFYRLHVIPVHVPPLRERLEDVPLLVDHFLTMYNMAYKRQVQGITSEALTLLCQRPWPGNIRELEHIIARLVATSRERVLDTDEVTWALSLS